MMRTSKEKLVLLNNLKSLWEEMLSWPECRPVKEYPLSYYAHTGLDVIEATSSNVKQNLIKTKKSGFTLLEVVIAIGLLSIIILTMASMGRFLAASTKKANDATARLDAKLVEVRDATAPLIKDCPAGNCNCAPSNVVMCSYSTNNGKGVEPCSGGCTKINGAYFLGSQICDIGVICKGGV